MEPKEYTILVADDEEASRFLSQEELGDDGYRVMTAENGLQVLGILEDHPVDLLLTDVRMPDMDALELVPKVRAEFPDMPIIVVTAFRGMDEQPGLKESRLSGCFIKPVNYKMLKLHIRELLAKLRPRGKKR
jgi:CheY-like chemotaxis protein